MNKRLDIIAIGNPMVDSFIKISTDHIICKVSEDQNFKTTKYKVNWLAMSDASNKISGPIDNMRRSEPAGIGFPENKKIFWSLKST